MSLRYVLALAMVLGSGASLLDACSGAQSAKQAQLATIVSGCKVALDIERDAGEAGAADDTADGCKAALHSWERAK